MEPAWLGVLSMFHIFRGFCKGLFPSFILHINASLMKQSVAPESMSALMSAISLLVLIETGICMDRNCVVTITELNLWTALTQADGFRRFENPLFLLGLEGPILVHLLPQLPFLAAMYLLVVAGSGWMIVRWWFLLRRCFDHRLRHRILD